MHKLEQRLNDWALRNWPWCIPAYWLGTTLVIGLCLLAVFGTDALPSVAIQAPILGVGATCAGLKDPYQARKLTL